MFIRKAFLFILLATVYIFTAQPADAALTKIDWRSAGDQLLVNDSETGFNWVYLPATYGYSYNDFFSLTNSGQYFSGCRLATTEEVTTLLTNGGVPTLPQFATPDAVNAVAIDAFQAIMGPGVDAWGDTDANVGFTVDQPFGSGTNQPVSVVSYIGSGGAADRIGRVDMNNSFVMPGDSDPTLGAWVIANEVVPEPATAMMVVFGGGVGLFVNRLRRWLNR